MFGIETSRIYFHPSSYGGSIENSVLVHDSLPQNPQLQELITRIEERGDIPLLRMVNFIFGTSVIRNDKQQAFPLMSETGTTIAIALISGYLDYRHISSSELVQHVARRRGDQVMIIDNSAKTAVRIYVGKMRDALQLCEQHIGVRFEIPRSKPGQGYQLKFVENESSQP